MTRAATASDISPPHAATTMRAALLTAPGRIELLERPIPTPGAGEVLVRLEGCGVCASSLPLWEGREWFEYPREPGAPGHEGWGVVASLGTGVLAPAPGTRVALLSYHAFAEYDVAPADCVVPLPRALDGIPFPGEPLGCAVNVVGRAAIEPGQTVAVVGAGFFGLLIAGLAVRRGARVIVLARKAHALDAARRLGAETVAMDDHWKAIESIRDLTAGRLCECVIEAAGAQWPLDLAGELTAERGRLVIAGYHQDGPRQVNMQQWNWRGLDVINAHERDPRRYVDGIREAVEIVAAGGLDPSPLFTHTFRLDQLADAFRMMAERPEGFLKALILHD